LFLRTQYSQKLSGVFEQLGVGAGTPWGAAEEVDYLIALADNGVGFISIPGSWYIIPIPLNVKKES
jgi:hypothetical protein